MANKEHDEDAPAEEKAAKPKSNLVSLIIIILAVVLIQVGLAFMVVKITAPKVETEETAEKGEKTTHGKKGEVAGEHESEGSEEKGPEEEKCLKKPIEAIVNIAGTDATRYLKVEIQIAFDAALPENKEYEAAFPYTVQVTSKITQYLSSLTLEEVNDKNAQENIREDLLRAINAIIPEHKGEISNVYITQYIIQ